MTVPPRALRESYDRSAARYDERFAAIQRPKHEAVLARLPASGRVLDVGCGTGLLTGANPISPSLRWIGVDLSLEMLRLAAGRVPDRVQGTALALPFRDASFDAAVAVTSLLVGRGDVLRALLEMRRVVRAGGLVIVTILVEEVPADLAGDLRASGLLVYGEAFRCGQDLGFTARRA